MTVQRYYIEARGLGQLNSALVPCPGSTKFLLVGCHLTIRKGQRIQWLSDETEIAVGGDMGPFGYANADVEYHLPHKDAGYADFGLENDVGLSLLEAEGGIAEGYVDLELVAVPQPPKEP